LNHSISTDVLLPQVKLPNNSSKQSPAFSDPNYLPFYFRLGMESNPQVVCQIGCNLGLVGACFIKGCKTVREWISFDGKNQNSRFVESNLKLAGCPKITIKDLDFSTKNFDTNVEKVADMAFLSESFDIKKTEISLDLLWNCLKPDGFLVVDYIHDTQIFASFQRFCQIKNREPVLFKTRYGIGIVIR
jgi:hypothetical protein